MKLKSVLKLVYFKINLLSFGVAEYDISIWEIEDRYSELLNHEVVAINAHENGLVSIRVK